MPAVRNLVADLVAAASRLAFRRWFQETVKAVAAIIAENPSLTETKEVNQSELAARLKLDKAAVSRRVSRVSRTRAICAISILL